jgi:hypothetical protein
MEKDASSPEPMVYSLIYIHLVPNKEPADENWSLSMEPPCGKKAYMQWGVVWFPQGDNLQHCNHYPNAMQPSA